MVSHMGIVRQDRNRKGSEKDNNETWLFYYIGQALLSWMLLANLINFAGSDEKKSKINLWKIWQLSWKFWEKGRFSMENSKLHILHLLDLSKPPGSPFGPPWEVAGAQGWMSHTPYLPETNWIGSVIFPLSGTLNIETKWDAGVEVWTPNPLSMYFSIKEYRFFF